VVQRCLTPQLLAAQQVWRRRQGGHANPAIQVLDEVAAVFAAHDQTGRWGPGGSVGFELASALPCTTPDSDLDLVLQADRPIALPDAARLQAELSKLPARIDVLLETPHGAVALSELVRARGVMLLRCPHGPRLVSDPWTADRAAASFS
jgi:phosphoribosyl-dephospho-CoA transferase